MVYQIKNRDIENVNVHLIEYNSDNETYTFKEMLQQEDKNEFIKAMLKEVQDHENRHHWHLFERNKIPEGYKTILAIWSFKRKRIH